MKKKELILNIFMGLSLIHWGIAGFVFNYNEILNSPVRIAISLLNIIVGIFIIIRKNVIKIGSIKSILISLPSFICGGIIFKLSKSTNTWGLFSEILFIIGGIITLSSFLFLGRNFSIFPALRQIVTRGTYRIIRHPSYFGELIMIIACLIESKTIYSILLFIVFIPAIIFRIKEEERLLINDLYYQTYKKTVKWRLIPFIW